MEGSEISIHHAFYWQKCLITHQIKQDGEPGSESVKRKIRSTQTAYVFSLKCDDWHWSFCEFILVNHAMWQIYTRTLCSYSVESDLWCWVICVEEFTEAWAWAASLQMDLVSLVETDEGRGRRGSCSCSHHRFPLILTYLQSCSVCFLFSPVHHVLPHTPSQVYSVVPTSFHMLSLLTNFVTSLWARVKLFTVVAEWLMIFVLRGSRGSTVL